MKTSPDSRSDPSAAPGDIFTEMLTLAREDRIDTSRAEFGFETRLAARIAELRRAGEAPDRNLWDEAIAWLWGGAAGAAPLVAGLAIWFALVYGLDFRSGESSGLDSIYHHLSAYLPSFPPAGG